MTVFAFDVDHTLEISGGSVTLRMLEELTGFAGLHHIASGSVAKFSTAGVSK